tara:strand:- start:1589 stop:2818 length:1230 start_codon:yes stop_codon:yes gene_type:complete
MEFREYQKQIIDKGTQMLRRDGFVYLAMQVRTGKTLTSLGIAQNTNAENVLFITKKKAIGSIEDDIKLLNPNYYSYVINYESLHKIPKKNWQLIIVDEAHSMGAFPKPSGRAKKVADLIRKHRPYIILMSGTPTPESYSQLYHQVYAIPNNPFANYRNFYRFADKYVDKTQKKINGFMINDYSNGKMDIVNKLSQHTITYSQKEAGFTSTIKEHVLHVPMDNETYEHAKTLKDDRVLELDQNVVLADTPVKLMQKLHQMYSGTVKFEDGSSTVLDHSKAIFIKNHFKDKKIGIFYKFKEELNALKDVFKDELTTELEEFKTTDKSIALQIVSGREGISLKEAKYLVYYNIDFSATSYWQSRDRMTTKERLENEIYWIFSKDGIEDKIYAAVSKKKSYTLNHFRKDLLNL